MQDSEPWRSDFAQHGDVKSLSPNADRQTGHNVTQAGLAADR